MKAGLTTSVILHAAVLGFGLITLRAPAAFDVADVEALPVDIVPVESITQIQEGDKQATMRETPTPTPTERPDIVPDAQETGENSVDTDKPRTPDPKPRPVETAEASAPAPIPKEAPKLEDVPAPKEEPKPVPATEVTPEAQPKQEVRPDPVEVPKPETAEVEAQPDTTDTVAEAIAASQPEDSIMLPDTAPAPAARPKPQPAPAQTAKAPDHRTSDRPAERASSRPKSEDESLDDRIAALLNKEKASGGGAKRSTEQASLGGDKSTGGSKLSQSEMDALRGQIQRCWNIPAGAADAENLRISVKFKLARSGELDSSVDVISGGGSSGVERAAAESAKRAVLRCAPYNLPVEKYDAWADVIVNFDPSDMF